MATALPKLTREASVERRSILGRFLSPVNRFSSSKLEELSSEFRRACEGRSGNQVEKSTFCSIVERFISDDVAQADPFLIEALFRAFDTDNSNTVDYREFIAGLSILFEGTPDQKVEFSFKIYDIDGDGFLTRDEMSKMMYSLLSMTAIWDFCTSIDENVELFGEDKDSGSEDDENLRREVCRFVDAAFKFDENHDSNLSLSEYKKALESEPMLLELIENIIEPNRS